MSTSGPSSNEPVKALFVHHSVGGQLLRAGLRDLIAADAAGQGLTVELWDHDYNAVGLSDGTGRRLGRSFPVPGDNTDPPGLVALADGAGGSAPYLAELRSFDLVLMKSCYPNNAIADEAAFTVLQATYERLFAAVEQWTGTTTVLVTSPPLTPWHTNAAAAQRAIRMAQWLVTTPKPDNVAVFDLFSTLAAGSGRQAGTLRREFRKRTLRPDSHPNEAGARAGAQALAGYLSPRWAELAGRAATS